MSKILQGLDTNEGSNAAVEVAIAQIEGVQVESKSSRMFSGPDSVQPAEKKLTVKTLRESRLMDDYEAYEIDFGAPNEYMLLVPASEAASTSTTTILTITTTSALNSLTHVHQDLSSGFPQNLQLMHNSYMSFHTLNFYISLL